MTLTPRSTWSKIAVFYILTLGMSSIFWAFILATSLQAAGLYYVTALMWCPAFAAIIVSLRGRGSEPSGRSAETCGAAPG